MSDVKEELCCFACGVKKSKVSRFHNTSKFSDGRPVCGKHWQQLRKHGKVHERTIYDRNEIITKEDYAEVLIRNRQQEVIKIAKVDIEDVELIKDYKWGFDGEYIYCKKLNTRLHRFVLMLKSNDKRHVDHINHKKEDNRKENLRLCSNRENSRNKGFARNKTGIIGVNYNERDRVYRARLKLNYKEKSLGIYNNLNDAIVARLKAEKKYFGEFAPQQHLFEEYGIGVD